MPTPWPKHPDGRNMRLGEMDPQTRRQLSRESVARLKAELEAPATQAALAKVLDEHRQDADSDAFLARQG